MFALITLQRELKMLSDMREPPFLHTPLRVSPLLTLLTTNSEYTVLVHAHFGVVVIKNWGCYYGYFTSAKSSTYNYSVTEDLV